MSKFEINEHLPSLNALYEMMNYPNFTDKDEVVPDLIKEKLIFWNDGHCVSEEGMTLVYKNIKKIKKYREEKQNENRNR